MMKTIHINFLYIFLFLLSFMFFSLHIRYSTYIFFGLFFISLLILLLSVYSVEAKKWLILSSSLIGGLIFALILGGIIGNDGNIVGLKNPLEWFTQKPIFLALSIFGWFGGIIYTTISDNNLELPTASIEGKNINPGILGDVLIGISGALITYHFLPNEWRQSVSQIAVIGIVGGYGGKVIIEAVLKKFVNQIEKTDLDEIKILNTSLSEENKILQEENRKIVSEKKIITDAVEKIKPYNRAIVASKIASMSLNDAKIILKKEIKESIDIVALTPKQEAAICFILSSLGLYNSDSSREEFFRTWRAFKENNNQKHLNLIGPGSVNILLDTLDAPNIELIDTIPLVAVEFIKQHEGLNLKAYPDPLYGWKIPTIGYGTTKYPNRESVKKGDTITEVQAVQYLVSFLKFQCKPALMRIPTWHNMNINQRSALYSFAFNLGPLFYQANNRQSITHLCDNPKLWGNHAKVKKTFMLYHNPKDPQVRDGLKKRRREEAELFCRPINLNTPITSDNQKAISTKEINTKQLIKLNVEYYSQLDNSTEVFGDGSRQCCTSSNAMLLNFILDGKLDIMALQQAEQQAESVYDDFVARYGDTTNHDAQTKALKDFGIESYWSTELNQDFLLASLKAEVPIVIGVHYKTSGHIVLVVGHDLKRSGFLIHDPYGTRLGSSNNYAVGQGGDFDLYTYSTLKTIWDPRNDGWGRVVTKIQGKSTTL